MDMLESELRTTPADCSTGASRALSMVPPEHYSAAEKVAWVVGCLRGMNLVRHDVLALIRGETLVIPDE